MKSKLKTSHGILNLLCIPILLLSFVAGVLSGYWKVGKKAGLELVDEIDQQINGIEEDE